MPITTQSAKAKGRNLQKWVRDLIITLWPELTSNDVRSTSMGASGMDIQLSSLAREKVFFSIECKSNKKNSIYALYKQAVSNKEELEPLLIVKADREKPLAVMDAETFFKLIKNGEKK